MKKKRLFIAIKIIPIRKLNEAYSDIKNELKIEKIRWVNTENLHFTLKFLGDTDENKIPEIIESLNKVSKVNKKSNVSIFGLGEFPNINRPRVIWLGMKDYDSIKLLNNDIEQSMRLLGFEKNDYEFKPHLTIGRIKYLKNKELLKKLYAKYKSTYFQSLEVDEFQLFESDLSSGKPVYTIIEKFNLSN